jgi:hypothetical protein
MIRTILKALFGAVLLHIALIATSILEVFVYSMLIDPGMDQKYYEHHAELSGPWISAIFGSLYIFLIVRFFVKRNEKHHSLYAISTPVIYLVIDLIIVGFYITDWAKEGPTIALANGVKFISAFAAIKFSRYSPPSSSRPPK